MNNLFQILFFTPYTTLKFLTLRRKNVLTMKKFFTHIAAKIKTQSVVKHLYLLLFIGTFSIFCMDNSGTLLSPTEEIIGTIAYLKSGQAGPLGEKAGKKILSGAQTKKNRIHPPRYVKIEPESLDFACTEAECKQKFPTRACLRGHLKNFHTQIIEHSGRPPKKNLPSHFCYYCKNYFVTQGSLTRHQSSMWIGKK